MIFLLKLCLMTPTHMLSTSPSAAALLGITNVPRSGKARTHLQIRARVGHIACLIVRTSLLVYRILRIVVCFLQALGSLVIGNRKHYWQKFGESFVVCGAQFLELMSGVLGIAMPILAYRLETKLYSGCKPYEPAAIFTTFHDCKPSQRAPRRPNPEHRPKFDPKANFDAYVPPLNRGSAKIQYVSRYGRAVPPLPDFFQNPFQRAT